MQTATAREKEVLGSLLSLEHAGMPHQQHIQLRAHQHQHSHQLNHHHYNAHTEEPHNLSTSEQQTHAQQHLRQQARVQHNVHAQQARAQQEQHVQHSRAPHDQQAHAQDHARAQDNHVQHSNGTYKGGGTGGASAVHTSHVQWMAPNANPGHQVIIVHTPAPAGDAGHGHAHGTHQQQQAEADAGMASIIEAAEQGQLVGQQVCWEPAEYAAGSAMQLPDGTVIPAHYASHAQPPPPPSTHAPAGQQHGYLLVEAAETPPHETGADTDAGGAESAGAGAVGKKVRVPAKLRRRRLQSELMADGYDPTRLEASADQVRERFALGCDCEAENCFQALSAEYVYRHRLNIAELSKHEHDMYLMGVTMASLNNWDQTARHKERKRMRAKYVFHGKSVCQNAFIYLENVTHYQLKKIRKHVTTHGVTPRVHGNHGKRPHNTFPLDGYKHTAEFLSKYLETFARHKDEQKSASPGARRSTIIVPPEINRKKMHEQYVKHCKQHAPDVKVMSYSAFREFLRKQYTHVRFAKPVVSGPGAPSGGAEPTTSRQSTAGGGEQGDGNPPLVLIRTCNPEVKRELASEPAAPAAEEPLLAVEVESQSSADLAIPEHHQTTTYTLTSRPFSQHMAMQSAGQTHYSSAGAGAVTSYQYSVAL